MMKTLLSGLVLITFSLVHSSYGLSCHHCELGADCATNFQTTESDCTFCLKYTSEYNDDIEVSRQCASVLYAGYQNNFCNDLERGDYKTSYCACDDVDNCNDCSVLVPSLTFILALYLMTFLMRGNC